jgi:hypothetical protein
MYPCVSAPTLVKIAKRMSAFLIEITLAPTEVSHGVAASFPPRATAIKKERK